MDLNRNETLEEFCKLIEKQTVKTAADKVEPNPYGEDPKDIAAKKHPVEDSNIIEQAHPESVYVAEALGDGGLVENQCEQQKKIIDMINRMPTGSIVARYASAALELIKLADQCDELGHAEAADMITIAAGELLEKAVDESVDMCPWCENPKAECKCDNADTGYCDACDRSNENCICPPKENTVPFAKAPGDA